jgi:hypothetical protein
LLLSDRELSRALGTRAREFAEKELSWRQAVRQTLEAYETVLSERDAVASEAPLRLESGMLQNHP